MFKKLIFLATVATIINAYAAESSNLTSVGAKQGSEELIGKQPTEGQKGQVYYSRDQKRNGSAAQIGAGSRSDSSQIFGEPKSTGKKGEKYYTEKQKGVGSAAQVGAGSKSGSEQIFDNK